MAAPALMHRSHHFPFPSENTAVDNTINDWYNWAYKNRIVIAITGGHTAFTPDGVPASLQEMKDLIWQQIALSLPKKITATAAKKQ